MGNICGLRRSQASAWAEVATFLIKRKWPKIDRGGPRAPSEAKGSAGGLRLGPPLVSWPVPSLRSPPGRAVGSSAKRKAFRGARQPGPPLDSQRFQAAFWAPFPTPCPGGRVSPDSAANSGRAGLTPPPWSSGAGSANPTRGPVEARTPPRTAGGPGRHPPLDGCRPARGSGGLPGRSLSLSLGRESEARTSGPTGVIYLSENTAGQKESGAQTGAA